jgi:ABC-type lipopolysaccharide export system ATPase subunit
MKKGDIVRSTGKGKTTSWGNIIGIVVQVEKDRIYVIWSNTYFEDEMTLEEVEPFKISEEVSQLKFSDGMVIHTHGPLRTVEFSDGWYVVGEGKLIPVKNEEDGLEIIKNLK